MLNRRVLPHRLWCCRASGWRCERQLLVTFGSSSHLHQVWRIQDRSWLFPCPRHSCTHRSCKVEEICNRDRHSHPNVLLQPPATILFLQFESKKFFQCLLFPSLLCSVGGEKDEPKKQKRSDLCPQKRSGERSQALPPKENQPCCPHCRHGWLVRFFFFFFLRDFIFKKTLFEKLQY